MPPKRTLTWGQAGLVTIAVAVTAFMSVMLVIIDMNVNHICTVIQGGC